MESCDGRNAARECLELVFQMSNILNTSLDCHIVSIFIAICDRGVNPEALATLVRELSPKDPAASFSRS